MIQQIPLPPLDQFNQILKLFNLRKLYHYLLYFIKPQQHIKESHQENKKIAHLYPQSKDRTTLCETICEILTEGSHQINVIGVQRLIMGMIIVGHVHVLELLVAEIMPLFLQIIEEDSIGKMMESVLSKFQQSELMKPSEKEMDSQKFIVSMRKKIRQFCKQTIFLLALWFPKSFYDPNKPSWFKKSVNRYDIKCKFIVYYTKEKMNQYQRMIKQLKFNTIDNDECIQCLHCLETQGQIYYGEQSIQPKVCAMPEVIEEEQPESIMELQKQKNQKKNHDNRYDKEKNSEDSTSGKINFLQKFKSEREQPISSPTPNSSRIKELLQKRRTQRKSNLQETLIKKSASGVNIDQFNRGNSNSHSKNANESLGFDRSLGKENNQMSRSCSQINISELRQKLKERKLKKTKAKQADQEYQMTQFKRQAKKQDKAVVRISSSHEKSLKLYSIMKDSSHNGYNQYKTSISPENKERIILFDDENFKSLGYLSKKLFRKECLKRKKKILSYTSQGITLDITSKITGVKLEINVNFFSEYAQNTAVKLISPKEPTCLVNKKNTYVFKFDKRFVPIIMEVNGKQLILPIVRVELLEDYEFDDDQLQTAKKFQICFKLDVQVFQQLANVASILHLKPFSNSYQKKYLYYHYPLHLFLQTNGDSQVKLSAEAPAENEHNVELLLKQIKGCLEKRLSKPIKKTINSTKSKNSFF